MGLLSKILRSLFGASKPSRGRTYQRPYEAPAQQPRRPARTVTTTVIVAEIAIATTLKGRCYVVDGDTITIGDTNIRLAGIDAPEMGQPHGEDAQAFLAALIVGKTLRLDPIGKESSGYLPVDSYKRLLCMGFLTEQMEAGPVLASALVV